MIPAERVLTEARSWMGTPWHHQARLKGVGVDCIGLVVGVCSALGLPLEDSKNYARYPDGVALAKELARQLVQRAPGGHGDAAHLSPAIIHASRRVSPHAAPMTFPPSTPGPSPRGADVSRAFSRVGDQTGTGAHAT